MNSNKLTELDEDIIEAIVASGAGAKDPAAAIFETLRSYEINPSEISLDLMKDLVVKVFSRRRFQGCNCGDLIAC